MKNMRVSLLLAAGGLVLVSGCVVYPSGRVGFAAPAVYVAPPVVYTPPPPPPPVVYQAPPPVVVDAPVMVPDSYVWDGYEYVGLVGDQYFYLGAGNVWLVADPFRIDRFHGWEHGHPDWRYHAIRNDRYRNDSHGHYQPRRDNHGGHDEHGGHDDHDHH